MEQTDSFRVQIIDTFMPEVRMYAAYIGDQILLHETTENHLTEEEFRELAMNTYK